MSEWRVCVCACVRVCVITRTLLEQARNTIAFLKQTLEEKGIVYDINALNALSKGMAGSKWSLMEELERRLLEILQDKSKSREEMKVRWPDPPPETTRHDTSG